jgi:nucleoid-associated protein YgaU
MNDPMDLFLQPTLGPTQALPASSRYSGIETALLETPDGRVTIYLRRRFVPPASRFTTRQLHRVVQGDRLDRLSAQYLGDPLLFWRIADANNAMRAEAIVEHPGRLIRIAMPEATIGLLR